MQVYLSIENIRQLILNSDKRQSHSSIRLVFNEYIHIAIGSEVVSQDRAEYRQTTDFVALTEGCNQVLWDFDACVCQGFHVVRHDAEREHEDRCW